jgi:histidinol-phosphatase (PHP family)
MPVDYHMHTFLSDGKDSHEDMVATAIYKGLTEIGFTDHLSLKPVGWAMPMERLNDMVSRVEYVRKSTNSGILKIRLGAEVDYFPGMEAEISNLIASLPLDYSIGSVHFIGDWNFDTDIVPYDHLNINQFYKNYFKAVQLSAQSGLFDIIGHCDLAKKFGYYPTFPLEELYEKTAAVFKESNVVVELNTSGRIKPCNEFYPSVSFLQILSRHKVPVTLGSDAHVEQNVGQFFSDALSELRALGYKEIAVFNKRKRGFIKI